MSLIFYYFVTKYKYCKHNRKHFSLILSKNNLFLTNGRHYFFYNIALKSYFCFFRKKEVTFTLFIRLFAKFLRNIEKHSPYIILCIIVVKERLFYCIVGIAVEEAISPASSDLHNCVIVFTCVWKFTP